MQFASRLVAIALLCAAAPPPIASAIASFRDIAPEPADEHALRNELKVVVDDFNAARTKYSESMRAAKSDEERGKIAAELAIQPGVYSKRALGIANQGRGTAVELDALISALNLMPSDDELGLVVDRVSEAHLDDPRVKTLAQRFQFGAEGKIADLLDAMIERSSLPEVRGTALLSRAIGAKRAARDDAGKLEAVEKDLNRIVAEFGAVDYRNGETLGDVAKRNLFELRDLAIGKPCPEIKGTDADGVAFNLSDYKGKVVFIDFWGFW
jgi:hypothetical protein